MKPSFIACASLMALALALGCANAREVALGGPDTAGKKKHYSRVLMQQGRVEIHQGGSPGGKGNRLPTGVENGTKVKGTGDEECPPNCLKNRDGTKHREGGDPSHAHVHGSTVVQTPSH